MYCTDRGGHPDDVYTTCGEEMPALLDTIFRLANERGLDLDFHVDENGNEVSKGILHISEAAIRNNFKGKVVFDCLSHVGCKLLDYRMANDKRQVVLFVPKKFIRQR